MLKSIRDGFNAEAGEPDAEFAEYHGVIMVKSMIKMMFALTLVLLTAISGFALDSVEARVDEFIRAEMARQKIPGVSLAVVKDGKPLIVKGYGLANMEHNVPVSPETIFQSGSVGKQFTSFAIMLLVGEGKIGLDEKIGKYLGDVPKSWANITIRHLLTHTSGMGDYAEKFDFQNDYTEDDLLRFIKKSPLEFAPGEKWLYSNFGYVTLGIIIRKVSGKFYGDFLQERIFKPLGMTSARVISDRDIVPNRAAGYELQNGEVKNQGWVSPSLNTTADGSLYLSVLDMIKWEDALATGKLLSKQSYEQMWTLTRLTTGREEGYGFGWALRNVIGSRVIEHGGAWQGFKSHIARYPDANLTVIALANSSNTNPARLANGVAQLIDPQLIPTLITDTDTKLTAEFRELLESVFKNKVDDNRFTPRVRKALANPDDRLLAHLKTIGPIMKFELLKRTNTGDALLYRYNIEFGSMNVGVEIGMDKNGKIGLFALHPE